MGSIDERVLILASTRKDAESSEKLLLANGLNPLVCDHMDALIEAIRDGAGALLLAKELLIKDSLQRLTEACDQQPSWSHLPIIILTGSGEFVLGKPTAMSVLKQLHNTTFLERPVRIATLISVLQSSLADRRRQYETRDLLQQLKDAKDEAERGNRVKSEFLANMSHEIRTPLGAVMGFSEMILDGNLSPEEKDTYGRAIRRNGQLLLALVNDILDLAKVEAGKIQIEELPIDTDELISSVVSGLRPNAILKGVDVLVKQAPDVPPVIMSDPVRVRQVLNNILGNAIKFTEKGFVRIDISRAADEGLTEKLIIDVIDTGRGISPEQQDKLFRHFSQADSSTTREYGGTGLGLVLSRQLAQALGGDLILLRSALGGGSTFRISLKTHLNSRAQHATIPDMIRTGPLQ